MKILSDAFSHDAEHGTLPAQGGDVGVAQYPNIAAIYGLEEDAAKSYLVMELVPGDTLRERISREGSLPIEGVLGICRQIAAALWWATAGPY